MPLKPITGPLTEPLSLAEAKLQCKVEHDDEDTLIQGVITSARLQAEHLTGRPFITQTWEVVLDAFPCGAIALIKANVLSIVSVTYLDLEGDSQTLAPTAYTLDAEDTTDCWLHPARDTTWPSTIDTANAVRVRFTCGYGSAADVPEVVRTWMKLMVSHYYNNREAVAQNNLAALPGVERILDSIRIWRA
jgi:uncharacterized phiE125 gp8 family phage protein